MLFVTKVYTHTHNLKIFDNQYLLQLDPNMDQRKLHTCTPSKKFALL